MPAILFVPIGQLLIFMRNEKAYYATICVWLTLCLAASRGSASGAPEPPCDGAQPKPAYALVGNPPRAESWTASTGTAVPELAHCTGWPASTFRSLHAVSGSFNGPVDANRLLQRFGAVTGLLTVRYWSVTDHAWRPLVNSATALSGFAAGKPRSDFTLAELQSGDNLYFVQQDGRSASEAIYRIRVRESGPRRFVIETENLTPIRRWGITLFRARDIQVLYFLDQNSPGIWSYYSLTKLAGNSWLTAGHDRSYINRTVALYRHLAGIPSDQEPPAAP
jgi:hypothetical protein